MTAPAPRSNFRSLIRLWAGAAVLLAGVVVWGAMQTQDPLQDYIHTDKVRHILAFGAIGLCAGLKPSALTRSLALGGLLTYAMLVEIMEIIQIPIPGREASLSDLFASEVGAFGGFGLGAAAWHVYEAVREKLSEQKASRRRP
ncbi:MAG: hypothetical protein ABL956_11280 [Hyphomonadaceae bacterium]